MDHVSILYSSRNPTTGAINMNGGQVTFDSGVIAHGLYDAVGVESGNFYMRNSIIRDCLLAFRHWPRDPIVNCTIHDVGRITQGGGQRFVNCSFVRVAEAYEAFGWSSTYGHCLFYNPPGFGPQSAQPVGSNGNIWADPLFKNADQGDFRLKYRSPCIDAGDGTAAPTTDAMGAPRYDDPRTPNTGIPDAGGAYADIGAYEFVETANSDIDLIAANVSGPSSVVAGNKVTVTWKVRNLGSVPLAGTWHDKIMLIPVNPGPHDVPLTAGEALSSGTLGPGQDKQLSAEVRVPGGTEGLWRWSCRPTAVVRCSRA